MQSNAFICTSFCYFTSSNNAIIVTCLVECLKHSKCFFRRAWRPLRITFSAITSTLSVVSTFKVSFLDHWLPRQGDQHNSLRWLFQRGPFWLARLDLLRLWLYIGPCLNLATIIHKLFHKMLIHTTLLKNEVFAVPRSPTAVSIPFSICQLTGMNHDFFVWLQF